MKISEHFSLAELTVTNTGLDNHPNAVQIANLDDLCANVLELLRKAFKTPVIVKSGFRSPEVNKYVGGSPNSQHLNGQAADIVIPGVDNAEVWQFIVDHLPFDQVIAEYLKEDNGKAGWIHVSHRQGKNRREALSCIAPGVYVQGLQFVEDK